MAKHVLLTKPKLRTVAYRLPAIQAHLAFKTLITSSAFRDMTDPSSAEGYEELFLVLFVCLLLMGRPGGCEAIIPILLSFLSV